MKLASLLGIASLATVTLLPRPAEAGGDEAIAAVGGFIGGVIVGAHLDGDRHHGRHDRYDRHDRFDGHGRHDRYDRHDRHHHGPVIIDRGPSHHRDGYWTFRTVRVWVPGQVIWSVNRWGHRVKEHIPGHYEVRRERVWVQSRGRGRW